MALKLEIQTNNDEVCTPNLSSIFLAIQNKAQILKLGSSGYVSDVVE